MMLRSKCSLFWNQRGVHPTPAPRGGKESGAISELETASWSWPRSSAPAPIHKCPSWFLTWGAGRAGVGHTQEHLRSRFKAN